MEGQQGWKHWSRVQAVLSWCGQEKNAVGMILREEYSKNAKNEKYKGLQLNEGEAGN